MGWVRVQIDLLDVEDVSIGIAAELDEEVRTPLSQIIY